MKKTDIDRALTPQSRIDLILRVDLIKDYIDVRSTVIYDYLDKDKIIVAQTYPPVRKSQEGTNVEVTFLQNDPDTRQKKRFGYTTKIYKLMTDYAFRADQKEQAIVIGRPTGIPKQTSVRLHYRVRPTPLHNITVESYDLPGKKYVIDISAGGILMSLIKRPHFEVGSTIDITLYIDEKPYEIKSEVVRLMEKEETGHHYAGLKFIDIDLKTSKILQDTINKVMRSELQERSGITPVPEKA